MTTDVDTRLTELRAACVVVEHIRRAADAADAYRDGLIRSLREDGYSAITIATAAEMHRSRVYAILAGEPESAEAHDALESAWRLAIDAWEDAGRAGTPDDFFPLEALLANA